MVRPGIFVGELVSWLAVFMLTGPVFLPCLLKNAALQDVVARIPTHVASLVSSLLEGIGWWGHRSAGRPNDMVSDWHCRALVESIDHFLAESMDVLAKLIQILLSIHCPFGLQSCEWDRSLLHTLDHELAL